MGLSGESRHQQYTAALDKRLGGKIQCPCPGVFETVFVKGRGAPHVWIGRPGPKPLKPLGTHLHRTSCASQG
eukprot:3423245-Alexandrium_andersonii.AAC.1